MRQARRKYNSAVERANFLMNTRNAWSEFAECFVRTYSSQYDTCYFATLTTQYTLSLASARRAVERFASIVKREGATCRIVWFAELYECKDGYHLHALLSTSACRNDLNKWWSLASKANMSHAVRIAKDNEVNFYSGGKDTKQLDNRSSFSKLKSGGKGGKYAAKYVAKGGANVDYDIIL
jgi:hypothetical protein